MDRRGGTSEVVDAIDFEENRLDDVVTQELKTTVPDDSSDILLARSEEVVEADDVVSCRFERLAKM